jgi:hypothetical protein
MEARVITRLLVNYLRRAPLVAGNGLSRFPADIIEIEAKADFTARSCCLNP